MQQPVLLVTPGVTPYDAALRMQLEAAARVRDGGPESLLLLQHPPVYTLGPRTQPGHLNAPPAVLRARGAEVVETGRGGGITFHGPGQVVGYPILDLRRRRLGPVEYVRLLEDMLIRTCASFGVEAWREAGRPGVWTARGKAGAIGVRFERGVSLHGFALNVDVDLSWFEAIVPCGISDAPVTSLAECVDPPPDVEAVMDELARQFERAFGSAFTRSPVCFGPTLEPAHAR